MKEDIRDLSVEWDVGSSTLCDGVRGCRYILVFFIVLEALAWGGPDILYFCISCQFGLVMRELIRVGY